MLIIRPALWNLKKWTALKSMASSEDISSTKESANDVNLRSCEEFLSELAESLEADLWLNDIKLAIIEDKKIR